MRFCYKIHEYGKEKILAISDKKLVGKHITDFFYVSKEFYGKDFCETEKVKDLVKTVTSVNAVGNEIVSFLIEIGVIDKNCVVLINGIKHAIMIKI